MPARSGKSALDPYGIYGTRTANRLRASRRRRNSQKFLIVLGFACLVIVALLFYRWRQDTIQYAASNYETALQVNTLPVVAIGPGGSEKALLIAGRNGQLVRLDLGSSDSPRQMLWRGDFPLHTPQVFEDKVFVPSEDGVLTALSWRSGKLLWRARFDSPLSAQPVTFRISQPSGQLQPIVVAASDSGLVMALEIASGRQLWRVRLPAAAGNGLSVVESNGRARVMVPLLGDNAMRGGVWCLNGANGELLWRFPADVRQESIQFASPVPDLVANRVFFANDSGAVFALNLTTGKYDPKQALGWKTVLQPSEEDNSPDVVVRAKPLLISHASPRTDDITRINTNSALLVGGNDGIVRYLSTGDGIIRWRFASGQPILSLSHISLSNRQEFVLVLNRSPVIFLLDARNGEVVCRFASSDGHFAGAVVLDQEIVAVTESGSVHRFDLSQSNSSKLK
jgi:outer membrane protein assembly factor BamB